MKSVVTVCCLVVVVVVVVFLGGCTAAVIPEASTMVTMVNTGSDSSTDSPSAPYAAASLPRVACRQKDVCADVLHSSIDEVECVEGMCRCLYNHIYVNDTCLRKKEYGDDDLPSDNMAEITTSEGGQKLETSTPSNDKTTTDSLKRTEPVDDSTGIMSKTGEEPESQNAMESENPQTTIGQPTMSQSTIGQPTTGERAFGQPSAIMEQTPMGQPPVTTPRSNEEVKAAAPSNVDPADSPKDETTQQSNDDKNSMQGDQPAEEMAAKPTEMPAVGVLQNCTSSLQCEHADAACVDGSCECKQGYVINPPRDRCLRVASRVSEPCDEDIQCIGKLTDFSYCKNRVCVCKEGTMETGGVCTPPKGLAELCMSTPECYPGMQCDAGKCACGQGSQPSDDKKTCIGEPAGATDQSAPVPVPAASAAAAAVAAPTTAPATAAPRAAAAPMTSTAASPHPSAPAASPTPARSTASAATPTKPATQHTEGGSGASTTVASLVVLCLGLFSTLQLMSCT